MKKVLTKLMALSSIGLLMLSACKKDGVLVTSNGGKAGKLTASTTTPVLDKALVSDTTTIIKFTFTAASYGFNAAVTNTLQIDAEGDNWANPASFVMSTREYSQGFSTPVFNNLLLKLNLPAGTASKVNVRIEHSLSQYVAPVYSNVLSLTVTPFNLTSWVYVPGDYDGWNNPGAGEDSLVSVTGNGIYTGIINFTTGSTSFLIVPVKNWANKWATAQGSTATATSATYTTQYVSGGDNNFVAPSTPGQYLITLNTNTNTLTMVQADYYSVIGSSTPGGDSWTDIFLKYINDGNGNWVGSFSLLAGQFKFRQDAAWTWSWGIPKPGTAGDGMANTLNDTSNDNINANAGNATVTFNMPATPLGTTPLVTTTYTLSQ